MMETFTINLDSLFDEGEQDAMVMETLSQTEKDFYESIKPVLNTFIKNPSDETVNKILDFSKSF